MLARLALRTILTRLRDGRLTVTDATGTQHFGPADAPAAVTVTVHDDRVWSALLRDGATGLATAYAQGWFETDDLVTLLRIAFANVQPVNRRLDTVARRIAPVRERLPTRSRGADVAPRGRGRRVLLFRTGVSTPAARHLLPSAFASGAAHRYPARPARP